MNAKHISSFVKGLLMTVTACAALVAPVVHADTPDARLITASPIDPAAALQYFSGSNQSQYGSLNGLSPATHTIGVAASTLTGITPPATAPSGATIPPVWPATPPEITALARTLGADRVTSGAMTPDTYVQNVFNYVHSNIEVEYRFGLGKGARGALIDQYGTPFDQAELMMKLLRVPNSSNITASYVVGTAQLTAQQFGLWTGLVYDLNQAAQTFSVDATAACQFMADGGIPATCSPSSGDLQSITILHIWLTVNGKVYDPSYKEYTLKSAIDLPSAMGCGSAGASTCGQTVVNAGLQGAAICPGGPNCTSPLTFPDGNNIPYIQNFSFYNVNPSPDQPSPPSAQGAANTLGVNLFKNILSQNRLWQVQDVVGGKTLAPLPINSFTSLPYTSTPELTWSAGVDIPDAFRTTLTVTAAGNCGTTMFYADEIANHRMSFTGGNGYVDVLYIDGMPTACNGSASQSNFTLAVNHPYAANLGAYGDDSTDFDLVEDPRYETGLYSSCDPFYMYDAMHGYGGSNVDPTNTCPNGTLPEPENNTRGSTPITIVHEFGDQSTSAQMFMSDLVATAPVLFNKTCFPSTSTLTLDHTCEEDSQATAAETIGPYRTLMGKIVSGVTNTEIIRHHDVGLVFASRYPGVDRVTMHEAESIDSMSPSSDPTGNTRAFEIESAVLTSVEGAGAAGDPNSDGDFAAYFTNQMMGTAGVKLNGTKVYDITPASMADFLSLSSTSSAFMLNAGTAANATWQWRQGQLAAAANSGYETIIADGGDAEIFLNGASRAYTIWEKLKGASAPTDPLAGELRTAEVVDTASARRKEYSVSEADGSLTFHAAPDIVTGTGEFPFSLPFIRTYKSHAIERTYTDSRNFVAVNNQPSSSDMPYPELTNNNFISQTATYSTTTTGTDNNTSGQATVTGTSNQSTDGTTTRTTTVTTTSKGDGTTTTKTTTTETFLVALDDGNAGLGDAEQSTRGPVNPQNPEVNAQMAMTQRNGWDSESYARLGGGWIHNYQITAEQTGDAAKGLGEDFASEATNAIAGVVILNDLLNSSTTSPVPLANRLATVSTLGYISQGLYGNVFIVKKGASAETLVRAPGRSGNQSFLGSNGSSATMGCTPMVLGTGSLPNDTCTYVGKDGDQINFVRSFYQSVIDDSGTRHWGINATSLSGPPLNVKLNSKILPIYAATKWVFPNGIRLDFEYDLKGAATASPIINTPTPANVCPGNTVTEGNPATGAIYCAIVGDMGFVLTKVSNNLGRSLTFNTTGQQDSNAYYYSWTINSVTDETGRSAQFNLGCASGEVATSCDTFSATDPNGNTTRYEYTVDANSPDPTIIEKPNYRLRRWYTPGSGTTPYAIFSYDDLYRIKSISTLVSGDQRRVTTYYPGGVTGTERRKFASSLSPSGFAEYELFDAHNNLIWSEDPNALVTSTTFDNANRPLLTIYPEKNSTAHTYDDRGNVLTEIENPKPNSALTPLTTSMTYMEPASTVFCDNPVICNKEQTETDPLGNSLGITDPSDKTHTTHYNWDASTGNLTSIVLPIVDDGTGTNTRVSPETDFGYTQYFNSSDSTNTGFTLLTSKTEHVTQDTTRLTQYNYVPVTYGDGIAKYALQSVTVDPSGFNLTTQLFYDPVGNLYQVIGPLGAAQTTTYHFDAGRRITRIDAPMDSTTRYTYDADGDVLSINRALVPLSQLADSDPSDPAPTWLENGQWQTTTQLFNPGGDLLSVTDPQGSTTSYDYDGDGRKVLVTDPDLRQTASILDPGGRVTCVWKGGTAATTNWTGASIGSGAVGCNNWNPGAYTGSGPFRYAMYTYNGNGKQLTVTDADNNTTGYAYDGMDRLQYTLFPDPNGGQLCKAASTYTTNYDSYAQNPPGCPNVTSGPGATYERYAYDLNGNRTLLQTRKGDQITFGYDVLNRQTSRSPTGQGQVTTSYDLANEPVLITKAANGSLPRHTTAYTYDTAGRKLSETNDNLTVSYGYNDAGQRIRTTWPDDYYVTYDYDALNRMTCAVEKGTSELAYYNYDTLSRRNYVRMGGGNTACTAGNGTNQVNYEYSSPGDVVLGALNHALNGTAVTLGYGYNNSHQLTSVNANDNFYLPEPASSFSTAYVPNALNQYSSVGGQSPTYDANGNLLTWYPSDGEATYTYDSENRLTSAAVKGSSTPTIFYDYDALGRRFSKTVNNVTTQYLLDGDEEIAEYDGSGNLLRRYVTGPAVDDRIMHQEINGSTITETFYHTNHQGSVIDMTDASGTVTQRLAYDEYGKLTTPNTGEMFRYTGRRFDPETGLYYYRARYYSPDLGRFLQTDPIGYKDDVDLYSYGGDDPTDNTDPSGNSPADEYPWTPGGQYAKMQQQEFAQGKITLQEYQQNLVNSSKGALLAAAVYGGMEAFPAVAEACAEVCSGVASATRNTRLAAQLTRGAMDGITDLVNSNAARLAQAQKIEMLAKEAEIADSLGEAGTAEGWMGKGAEAMETKWNAIIQYGRNFKNSLAALFVIHPKPAPPPANTSQAQTDNNSQPPPPPPSTTCQTGTSGC